MMVSQFHLSQKLTYSHSMYVKDLFDVEATQQCATSRALNNMKGYLFDTHFLKYLVIMEHRVVDTLPTVVIASIASAVLVAPRAT